MHALTVHSVTPRNQIGWTRAKVAEVTGVGAGTQSGDADEALQAPLRPSSTAGGNAGQTPAPAVAPPAAENDGSASDDDSLVE